MGGGTRPEARLCRPFWLQIAASPGGTARFRVPDGWVIRDLKINFPSTNGMKLRASTDRELRQCIPVADGDFEKGILPFYFDATAYGGGWYPSTSVIWEWHDIQYAELRAVVIEQDSSGWSDQVVVIGGVLVPDPRRF